MSTRYTLIDYFNAFQNLKRRKNFSAGVQSAYFAILGEFNLQRYPAELALSTRELKELAGLKSVATAHEVRNVLKNNKLVDFETKRGTTIYRLLSEHLPNEIRTATERRQANQPNDNRTPHALSSNAFLGTQMETETVEEKTLSIDYQSTRARNTTDLDTLLEYWDEELKGGRLTFEHQSQIAAWLAQHGLEWVKSAMREASDANGNSYGVNFKLLRGVIERKANPMPLKGGEKSGGTYSYERPSNGTEPKPWDNY